MKLKVTKGELIISNHLEMADGYIQWWLPVPPPSLIRVNGGSHTPYQSSPMIEGLVAKYSKYTPLIWGMYKSKEVVYHMRALLALHTPV